MILYFFLPQTSYEFVQRWNSIPRSARSEDYAELLKLIPLQQLPESERVYVHVYVCFTCLLLCICMFAVITNKLDGTMLTNVLKAIDEHFIPEGI